MSPSLLQSTLFLLIPLFSIALTVLACSHSPGPLKPQAILAYIYIASVTLLSTLAGALPLSHSSSSLSESLIQALLFLFIGIPVLHLAPTYVPHLSNRRLHTSVLVITLSIATLFALISPFLPTATPLLYISPSLFLLYTLQSIPRIAYILNNFLYPEDSTQSNPTISLTLPSPASTASFPEKHHHKIPSVSTTSTITIVDRTRIFFPPQDQLRSQIVNSRSRSLLVFILAVQVASLAANACALGVAISASHNPTTLKTIQTACTVLALTGSMSAYLLHIYNLHLRKTPASNPIYNNLSIHSPEMLESQQHHSNSHSSMLIQLAPPPLPKARHSRANAIEKNLETNPDSLELDVVVDIASYSMTLGRLGGPSSTPRSAKKDSVDVGLRLVSSPACTPVPAALPIPLPLRVSVEEGSTFSTLEKRKKEKIQEYYLSSSSSPSTASPSSPSSQFERCGTETDPSSPDTPYPNVARNDDANTNIVGSTQVRKRSSFFGWEFAWDQEALERADDAGKLRSTVGSGGSPVRWKSDLNPSSSEKILIVDQASFTDLDEDVDADEDAGLQKTPTMKSRTTTRSYSHSPQSHHHSTCSSPNQQRHEAATSIHCSSINKSCITTSTTMNSPQKLSPSLTRRGLSLKRSFQMGSTVGRTLGPGLTLSSAELRFGSDSNSGPLPTSNPPDKSIRRCESERFGFRGEEEKRESEEKGKKAEKFGKEDDEDVDVETEIESEMRSLGAARPVPASYARATATATILTPATGTDIGVDSGGGCKFASRSGGGNPVKYTAMSKTKLHSRPSLPTMNTTTTVSSPPACSTITEQYQQQQHGRNSVFSTAARKPHPFIDWFRSLETSTSRGDADVEQEMEIIRRSGRGSGNERLSSLPLLPPLPPLLLPSLTPPSQSQSLPPTPTKSQSTLLGKPSTSSFKKRSVPPALPPLPRSSEWAHSMLTTNGVSGAAISVVSLAHSRTRSVSRTSSQLPSRPTTPKPSTRLSAMNMGSVRNAFAGVGAKVSARMSINSASTRSSAGATASNTVASSVGMGMDDIDGDFMDLRDPFASPPPFKLVSVFRGGDHTGGGGGGGSDFWVSERAMSSLGGGAGVANYDDDDSVEVGITRRISSISGGKRRVNMNAWGRLPIPSTLPLPGTAPETSNGGVSSEIANRKKAHSHHGERRKHKKEKRARKAAVTAAGVLVETNPSLHGYSAPCSAGEEDADFGVEEALLSQRLLRRLDSVSFEWD